MRKGCCVLLESLLLLAFCISEGLYAVCRATVLEENEKCLGDLLPQYRCSGDDLRWTQVAFVHAANGRIKRLTRRTGSGDHPVPQVRIVGNDPFRLRAGLDGFVL